jgi:hypothetical protein
MDKEGSQEKFFVINVQFALGTVLFLLIALAVSFLLGYYFHSNDCHLFRLFAVVVEEEFDEGHCSKKSTADEEGYRIQITISRTPSEVTANGALALGRFGLLTR